MSQPSERALLGRADYYPDAGQYDLALADIDHAILLYPEFAHQCSRLPWHASKYALETRCAEFYSEAHDYPPWKRLFVTWSRIPRSGTTDAGRS
jgi:hypothetical protein